MDHKYDKHAFVSNKVPQSIWTVAILSKGNAKIGALLENGHGGEFEMEAFGKYFTVG